MKSDVPMGAYEFRARKLIAVVFLLLVSALSGCAHNNPRDPLEPMNRGIYAFNDAIDTVVMKPIATGYNAILPQFVRTGVSNFFSNLDEITVIINGLLQLKIPQALSDTGRFLINTTVGVLGLIDVATHLGLEKHNEDFGQTLGYWGIGSGPYLVLPILGPSSFRDGVGKWVDFQTDLVLKEDHIRTRNRAIAARAISNRADLLRSEKVLDAAAIDRYAFLRDAYLQRRRNLVFDGNPPPEPEDEEFTDKPKPRSESAPDLPPAVLVDQFDNVVTAGEANTPVQAGRTKAAAPQPAPLPAPRVQAPSGLMPVSLQQETPREVPAPAAVPAGNGTNGTPPQNRIVRVWLSSSATQQQ